VSLRLSTLFPKEVIKTKRYYARIERKHHKIFKLKLIQPDIFFKVYGLIFKYILHLNSTLNMAL
jgi:hypothetical protein